MTFKVLYIDTNIFLHYKFFDEIDWLSITNAERVEIRLAKIVIHEMDKHKYHTSSAKIRDRSNKVVKKLHNLIDQGLTTSLKPNINISFEMEDVHIESINHNLDPQSQDDKLLASILNLKAKEPDLYIVLVAADLGLRLKAKAHDIECICLPDDLKLPVDLDPHEKRVKELEKELLEIKRVIPNLSLGFAEQSNQIRLTYVNPFTPKSEVDLLINKQIDEVKQKYPKMPEINTPNKRNILVDQPLSEIFGSNTPEILPSDIIQYNKNVDSFYLNCENYMRDVIIWNDKVSRSFAIEISIYNTGTCPAEDIDVFMHFPDGFSLLKLSELPNKPQKPQPPAQPVPKTNQDRMKEQIGLMTLPSLPLITQSLYSSTKEQPNISFPKIRKSNSYDVELTIKKVKHNSPESFYPLIVVFDSHETIKSFRIDYKINAANVPKTVSGCLHVILDKQSENIDEK